MNVAGTIVGGAIGGFGGTIQTYGSATLDGVTLNSIYTAGPGTVTTVKHALLFGSQVANIPPTFQISGTLNVVSGGGQNTIVNVDDATFGNGSFFGFTPTVALSSTDGNGAAYIRGGSANTLTNDVIIEGAGFIGDDGLNLVNNGTLLATAPAESSTSAPAEARSSTMAQSRSPRVRRLRWQATAMGSSKAQPRRRPRSTGASSPFME